MHTHVRSYKYFAITICLMIMPFGKCEVNVVGNVGRNTMGYFYQSASYVITTWSINYDNHAWLCLTWNCIALLVPKWMILVNNRLPMATKSFILCGSSCNKLGSNSALAISSCRNEYKSSIKHHLRSLPCAVQKTLGLYSLSGKTSYRKISWRLEAARYG